MNQLQAAPPEEEEAVERTGPQETTILSKNSIAPPAYPPKKYTESPTLEAVPMSLAVGGFEPSHSGEDHISVAVSNTYSSLVTQWLGLLPPPKMNMNLPMENEMGKVLESIFPLHEGLVQWRVSVSRMCKSLNLWTHPSLSFHTPPPKR